MVSKAIFPGGFLLLLGLSAGAAQAVTLTATYTGTIAARGYDRSNLFGAGADLSGQAFRLVVTFDPETPGALRQAKAQSDDVAGGIDGGGVSPVRSARLTINNHTESFGIGTLTTLSSAAYEGESYNGQFALDQWTRGRMTGTTSVQAYAHANDPGIFPSILGPEVPLTRLGGAGQPWGEGLFSIYACEATGDGCVTRIDAGGRFEPASVRIAAVPVPASLPLFLSGLSLLALLGLARRRLSRG